MSLDKSGVLHIPLSNYAFSIDENTLCLRIRAKINNVKEINLFYDQYLKIKSENERKIEFTRVEIIIHNNTDCIII